ncbi:flagellar basal body protein [Sphingomonas sp. CCH5-D11]|uniref:flagellar basal body protein n=1 Tax=Sphingomonas sp. CCH5-D11 TaxID=1768786 RepID=UPI002F90891F
MSQAALRTVSNNVANVSTPGYARQRVEISTGVTAGSVNGVIAGEPSRVADRFLESTVYRRAGDMGRADVSASYLDRLQSLLAHLARRRASPRGSTRLRHRRSR